MLKYEELPEINSERWLSLDNFEDEEWRNIEGANGAFLVSNYGRIKATERKRANRYNEKLWPEKIRKVHCNKKGYPIVSLTVNCRKIFVGTIHRLVAKTFLPNHGNKPEVDHINTIRTDNRVCNLRWVTSKENAHNSITEKRVRIARSKQIGSHLSYATKRIISEKRRGDKNPMYGKNGVKHPRSIAVIQLTLNGEFVREWECARKASEIYGCHITDCCRGNRNQCGGYKWEYKYNFKGIGL